MIRSLTALLITLAVLKLRPATVEELQAGKSAGGLRFGTEDLAAAVVEDSSVVSDVTEPAADAPAGVSGTVRTVRYKLSEKSAGQSALLRIYEASGDVTFVIIDPWWPASAPHDVAMQAKRLGIEVRAFHAASERLGTLHETDTPNLYAGLVRDPSSGAVEIRHVVLVRQPEWLSAVARIRDTAGQVSAALARKDAVAARAALPDPFPLQLSPDSELARTVASIDAFEQAQREAIARRAEGDTAQQIVALGQAARLVARSGGDRAPVPFKVMGGMILMRLAQSLGADAEEMRATDELRALFLEALAGDARDSSTLEPLPGRNIEAVAVRLAAVHREIAHLSSSSDPLVRAGAVVMIRNAIAWDGYSADTRQLYDAAIARGREEIAPELARAAAAAESKNLLVTAAASWYVESTMRDGEPGKGRRDLDWQTAAAGAGEDPFSKAQATLARFALGLVPAVTASGRTPAFDSMLQYTYGRTLFATFWPLSRVNLRETSAIEQAASAGTCDLSTENPHFEGRMDSSRETKNVSQWWGTWVYDEAAVRAWEQQVAALESSIAANETAARPSTAPLGTEVKGAAAVTVMREETDSSGRVNRYVVAHSPQNVYRVGVLKAAKAENERIEQAEAALSFERSRLESLLRSKPVVGQTWTGFKNVSGVSDMTYQKVRGRFTRDLVLTCGDGTFRVSTNHAVSENLMAVAASAALGQVGFDHTLDSKEDAARELDHSVQGLGFVLGKVVATRGLEAVEALEGVGPEERATEAAWIGFFFGVDQPTPVGSEESFTSLDAIMAQRDAPPRVRESLPGTMPGNSFRCWDSDRSCIWGLRDDQDALRFAYTTAQALEIWNAVRDKSRAATFLIEVYPWIADREAWLSALDEMARTDAVAAQRLRDATIGLPE